MSEAGKAVFLSYASQDAEAAKRICEALRGAGVEVWFDLNELRGGDAWDAKIRRQIKVCALFVPVVSANTDARPEGYFRLEWLLAVERARLMADDHPFLFPIAIGEVNEAKARVPEKFREVQWTRVRLDETPAELAGRVARLLTGGSGAEGRGAKDAAGAASAAGAREGGRGGGALRWWWMIFPVVGTLMGLAWATKMLWSPRKEVGEAKSASAVGAAASGATASGTNSAAELVRQARALVYDADAARHEFALAEGLIKRATDLAPDSGEAWGVSALLQQYFATRAYASDTKERLRRAREQAEKALRLAPENVDALLALGLNRVSLAGREAGRSYIERAAGLAPDNPRVVLGLSVLREPADRIALLTEAAQRSPQPAELWYYAASAATRSQRMAEARTFLERARAARPLWRIWVAEAHVEYFLTADADRVEAWLQRVPELRRDDPRVVFFQWRVALLRGDGAAALRALSGLADDFIEDNFYSGPKALLQAQAHEAAGQPERAKQQWELAARLLRERLIAEPGDVLWQAELALALSATAPAEARETAAKVAASNLELPDTRRWREIDALEFLAQALARLNEPVQAVAALRRNREFKGETGVSQAMLARERRWDPLRGRPEFSALLEAEPKRTAAVEARAGGTAEANAVAVLPFENLSGDPEQEYFSDGLTEEILNALARDRSLRVPGRASAFSFKGRKATSAEIARALNVSRLVEGSVRRSGNRVRISVTLTRASDGFSEEVGTFTEELTDVFALQDRVAAAVVTKLTQRVAAARVGRVPTRNPAAYDAYLRGRALQVKAADARGHFEEAVKLDPEFALAWVGLAEARLRPIALKAERSSELVTGVEEAIARALALRPEMPEALIVRARLAALVREDFSSARRDLAKAEAELGPIAELRYVQAQVARDLGDWEAATRLGAEAADLDPQNVGVIGPVASILQMRGLFPEAAQLFRRANTLSSSESGIRHFVWSLRGWRGSEFALQWVERNGHGLPAYEVVRTELLIELGRTEEARQVLERVVRTPGPASVEKSSLATRARQIPPEVLLAVGLETDARVRAEEIVRECRQELERGNRASDVYNYLARAEAALGQREAALGVLREWAKLDWDERSSTRRITEYARQAVVAYVLLGETKEALALIDATRAAGFRYGYGLRASLFYRPLHSNQRFQAMMAEEEEWARSLPDPEEK